MNKIIALTVGLAIAGLTIILAINGRIGTPLTIVLLGFSLLAGFVIAKHDDIEEMKTKWFDLKTFDNKVKRIKDEAIEAIHKDIRDQKEDLSDLGKALVKNAFLILQTKNEFGGPRDQQARAIMVKDINDLLPKILPDRTERNKWVNEIQNILPKNN